MQPKKIVLAYSGGMDTSVILKWLQQEYNCPVYAYCANLGQDEDLTAIAAKAKRLGAAATYIDDCRASFVAEYVFPMLRANAIYEGSYQLGTAIARPVIAKRQVAYAQKIGADAIAHGATGKGNDQLRFEFAYATLAPELQIIAPWRTWSLATRNLLVDYAEKNQIPIPKDKIGEPAYSVDANLFHVSAEGKILEDPAKPAPAHVYQLSKHPREASSQPEIVSIKFAKGDAYAVNGKELCPYQIVSELNKLAIKHSIGRLDMLETKAFGTKSRGIYETPGGCILLHAHRAIEQLTVDGEAIALKDQLMPKYAKTIYDGYWFSPEREMLQALIDTSQKYVEGEVQLELYKGAIHTLSRHSRKSLYSYADTSFDATGSFSQADASAYIRIVSSRLRQYANQQQES